MEMTKGLILGLSSLSLFATLNAKESKDKINVVYILADDLGYGDIGCYGQKITKTPNIDKLASEGLLFTQNYAGCTVSAPSRCSLMTGLTTGHTQVRGNLEYKEEGQEPLEANTFTIGRLMQQAGYVTGIFGKWGLGYPGSVSVPNKMGFDEFFGYNCQRQSHTYYPTHLWHNEERVEFPENQNKSHKTYSEDIIHQKALDFIKDNKDKPFFAMLTYTIPHAELNLPHDSIYKLYENKFPETPYKSKYGYREGFGGYDDSEQPKASFAAMVTRLDKYVGDIISELKKYGLDKNTLVIFTSDNGPHMEGGAKPDFFDGYGPLKGVKRDVYEGGIRVPMIAWLPSKINVGKTDHIAAFWDVMPTLAQLSGSKLKAHSDGISFLPTLFGTGKQKNHDYLYWEFHEMGGRQALRMGKWKLIRQPILKNTKIELYDLDKDIHEDNDLSQKYPAIVKTMLKKMDGARTPSSKFNFGKE